MWIREGNAQRDRIRNATLTGPLGLVARSSTVPFDSATGQYATWSKLTVIQVRLPGFDAKRRRRDTGRHGTSGQNGDGDPSKVFIGRETVELPLTRDRHAHSIRRPFLFGLTLALLRSAEARREDPLHRCVLATNIGFPTVTSRVTSANLPTYSIKSP